MLILCLRHANLISILALDLRYALKSQIGQNHPATVRYHRSIIEIHRTLLPIYVRGRTENRNVIRA